MEQLLQKLREHGYVVIQNAFEAGVRNQLLSRILRLHANAEKPDGASTPYLNRGHDMIYNLQNKDLLFVKTIFNQPTVRALLMKTLNDDWYKQLPADRPNYILRAMAARTGGPEALPLHIDSFIPSNGTYAWSMQTSFILEDQHVGNGCTVAVPGSHLLDRYADQASMAKAVPIEANAGDVLVWDSRLWHGTTANTSGRTRWVFVATFTRWWIKQNYDITGALPEAIYAELTDEERAIMGYCSRPPRDELERIDIKGGYELLSR